MAISRDIRTGYFDGFALVSKSDFTKKFVAMAEGIRRRFGPDHQHLLVRTLLLDNAGEQRSDNSEFATGCEELAGGSCERIYSDPSR
eukprot:COSAG01_NODE_22815_length_840_cov_1.008097_1_plen_86_part_10